MNLSDHVKTLANWHNPTKPYPAHFRRAATTNAREGAAIALTAAILDYQTALREIEIQLSYVLNATGEESGDYHWIENELDAIQLELGIIAQVCELLGV